MTLHHFITNALEHLHEFQEHSEAAHKKKEATQGRVVPQENRTLDEWQTLFTKRWRALTTTKESK